MARRSSAPPLLLLLLLLLGEAYYIPPTNATATAPAQGEGGKSIWDQIAEGARRLFGGIWDAIAGFASAVAGFASSAWGFFSSAVEAVKGFFDLLSKGADVVGRIVGRTGDVANYTYVQSRLALYACCAVNASVREVAADALTNCSKYRLKDVAWMLDPRFARDGRRLCDLAPSGFLGMVSVGLAAVAAASGLVAWFFQNFLLVHAVAFGGTLSWSLASALTRRSVGPLEKWADWWGKYVGLYARFFRWLLDKLMQVADIIAELLPL